MEDMFNIDDVIKSLYLDSPFFGVVLNGISRKFEDRIPTACVTMHKELLVNKEFWSGLSKPEQKAVLKHEILHLAFLHFSRFYLQMKDGGVEAKLANIATDCAINQHLTDLPGDCVTLEWVRECTERPDLEELQSAEYYFKALIQKKNEIEEKMETDPEFKKMMEDLQDGHGESIQQSENEQGKQDAVAEAQMRKLLDKAKQEQEKFEKKNGTKSGNSLSSVLPSYVQIDKNVWKRAISKSIGSSPQARTIEVYNRPNRRNAKSLYGKKHVVESSRLYVGLDTSASITDEEIAKFVSHINRAMKSEEVVCDIIHCDSVIQKVDLGVKQINPKKGIEVAGRGGTDLRHIQKYITERENGKKTRLVLLTDGYTAWDDCPRIDTTVIYTKDHTKLDYVKYAAVLNV
jgi:predicted metal-dependent peptidase